MHSWCTECQLAEAPSGPFGLGRALTAARLAFDAYRARPTEGQRVAAAMFAPLRAMVGGPPAPTPYDRHRADWERDGDPADLDRMIRHIYG